MPKNLQTGLYKTIVKLKKVLEADWAVGHRGKGYDLPTMAAGCEYGGVEKYGFSGKKGKKERADIIYPLDKLLLSKPSKFSLRDKKIPRIVFKKHRKPNNQYEYTSDVKAYLSNLHSGLQDADMDYIIAEGDRAGDFHRRTMMVNGIINDVIYLPRVEQMAPNKNKTKLEDLIEMYKTPVKLPGDKK